MSDAEVRRTLPLLVGELGTIRGYQVLGGGTYNTAVAVQLDDGQELIVKLSPPRQAPGLTYEAGLLATEADYFVRTLPFVGPVPVVYSQGSGIAPERDHLVMSRLPGRSWAELQGSATLSASDSVRCQLGRILALAHQAPCSGFGYMFERPDLRGPTWPAAFSRMMEAALTDADGYQTLTATTAAAIRGLISRWSPALAEVVRPALVHFDLWDGNVLVEGDGEDLTISGIIDAERAFYGDPAFEFPSLSVFSARLKDDDFVIDDAFAAGYRESGGALEVTGNLRARVALYRIYLYVIMLTEIVPRQIDGDDRAWRQRECRAILAQQMRLLSAN
jgi:Ser/Thr protein kinase RdoA (MazF antagonist)